MSQRMAREDEREDEREGKIDAIIATGRRTRSAPPRWLWITAVIVGVICITGFAVVMLGAAEPSVHPVARAAGSGAGFGTGLGIGAAGGVALGFALARQRRDHSSRRRP
jgi:hypothetical protein